MKCERCGEELEKRDHRRTNLCEMCYREKRRDDVKLNVRKSRTGSKELMRKRIIDRRFLDVAEKVKEQGLEIVEVNWPLERYISDTCEFTMTFKGLVKFPAIPKGMFCRYSRKADETTLYYKMDTYDNYVVFIVQYHDLHNMFGIQHWANDPGLVEYELEIV